MTNPATTTHRSTVPFFIILLALSGYFVMSIAQTATQINQNRQRLQELQTQVNQLKQTKATLQAQLNQRQSAAYIELEARNQLSMARDGETVVIFPTTTAVLGATTQNNNPATQPTTFSLPIPLLAWQQFFFKS